jgi:hypothetical protein
MSCRLEATSAKRFTKCVCCEEQIRTCEPMTIVVNETTNRPVRGERYCPACASEGYPQRNNVVTVSTEATIDPDSESERRFFNGAYRRLESQGFAESN